MIAEACVSCNVNFTSSSTLNNAFASTSTITLHCGVQQACSRASGKVRSQPHVASTCGFSAEIEASTHSATLLVQVIRCLSHAMIHMSVFLYSLQFATYSRMHLPLRGRNTSTRSTSEYRKHRVCIASRCVSYNGSSYWKLRIDSVARKTANHMDMMHTTHSYNLLCYSRHCSVWQSELA